MRWLIGLLAAAFFVTSAKAECVTPAMIDGAMSVIHPSWERTYMDGVEGQTFLNVWNNGSQRPKADANSVAIYIRNDAVLMWTFRDNCMIWVVEDEPIFMPLYFYQALNRGKERRMGPAS